MEEWLESLPVDWIKDSVRDFGYNQDKDMSQCE